MTIGLSQLRPVSIPTSQIGYYALLGAVQTSGVGLVASYERWLTKKNYHNAFFRLMGHDSGLLLILRTQELSNKI